jgi:hypothetical protein
MNKRQQMKQSKKSMMKAIGELEISLIKGGVGGSLTRAERRKCGIKDRVIQKIMIGIRG